MMNDLEAIEALASEQIDHHMSAFGDRAIKVAQHVPSLIAEVRALRALARRATPAVSVETRERALVDVGYYDMRAVPDVQHEAEITRCVGLVDATHPRAPDAAALEAYEQAAKVCEAKAAQLTAEPITPKDEAALRSVVAKAEADPRTWDVARRRGLIAYGPQLLAALDVARAEVATYRENARLAEAEYEALRAKLAEVEAERDDVNRRALARGEALEIAARGGTAWVRQMNEYIDVAEAAGRALSVAEQLAAKYAAERDAAVTRAERAEATLVVLRELRAKLSAAVEPARIGGASSWESLLGCDARFRAALAATE